MPMTSLSNVADWDTALGYIRTAINSAGGWTLNQDLQAPDIGAAANGRILVATNGDCLVGLRSTQSGSGANRLYLFDGVPPYGTPAFTTMDNLPNNSGLRVTNTDYTSIGDAGRVAQPAFAGPFPTMKIFTNNPSTYCHVVIEVSAGRFRHLAFGNAIKFGTWTGGGYYALTCWNQTADFAHFIDDPGTLHAGLFDSALVPQNFTLHYEDGATAYKWRTPQEITLNGVLRRQCYGSMRGGFGQAFRNRQSTAWSGFMNLVPITLWPRTTTDSPATVRCAAQIPDLFEVNMRFLTPAQILTIGASDYYCFPISQKGIPTDRFDVENSGYYGLAYKKIP